ncbi:hypothetical protein ACFS6H_02570 [Terrimonas rubra]|uniref:Uncharacterized protein n=1 Tax=Terrimonas rubra TaxID=1035890 RepID=A0ABW6A2Y6_9BACT
MKCFLPVLFFIYSISAFAQTKPKAATGASAPAMSFTVINKAIAPKFGLAGKHPANIPVYILDHNEKKIFNSTTGTTKQVREEFATYTITPLQAAPPPMYGMYTVILNPVSTDIQFISEDSITDKAEIEAFAQMLVDSNSLEKKFKATVVDKNSQEYKAQIEQETRDILQNRSFKLFSFKAGELTVKLAKFPNAVFLYNGNSVVYTPSFVDNYIISAFTVGDRLFVDLPGYMMGDPKYPTCDNWNSRIMEVTANSIVQRSFSCY